MNNRLVEHLGKSKGPRDGPNSSADQSTVGRWLSHLPNLEPYLRKHPATTIGAALLLGVCIGWLHKRR